MKKFLLLLVGTMLLVLCSCFSQSAKVEHFGKTLKTEYGQACDGSEYVDIYGNMGFNSALIMPSINFSVEQDTIHVDAVLTLVENGKSSLGFPWRIPLSRAINRITFGPKNEIIWERPLK